MAFYSFYGGKQGISYDIRAHFDSVEDMVAKFALGGSYVDVNYGEYVLIDTIIKLNEKDNPQNGLLYRRGFEYTEPYVGPAPKKSDYIDPETGEIDTAAWRSDFSAWASAPGGGAEYVGQIVGPSGETPEMAILKESEVREKATEEIKAGGGTMDIIPGIRRNEDGEVIEENDQITFAYCNMRDRNGNITGCILGFTMPYHVFKINAKTADVYDIGVRREDGSWDISNIELIQKLDGNTDEHPFHSDWLITVPNGIHGSDVVNFLPDPESDINSDTSEGIKYQYYYDTIEYTHSDTAEGTLTRHYIPGVYHRMLESVEFDEDTSYYNFHLNTGETYYVKARMLYDIEVDEETARMKVIFTDWDVDEEGQRHRSYKLIGDPMRYIKEIEYESTGPNAGTITFVFNDGERYTIPQRLKTMQSIYMNQDNKLVVLYTDGETEIIDYVFKTVKEVKFDEVTGLFQIVYQVANTGDPEIDYEYQDLSTTPLNSVEKIAIDDRGHMLIYYSSSIVRQKLIDEDIDVSWEGLPGWADVGYARGEAGGIHILGNLDSVADLPAGGPEGVYKGWVYTVNESTFYAYDYEHPENYPTTNGWYSFGQIDSSMITPNRMVIVDKMNNRGLPEGGDTLQNDGVWFIITSD